MHLFTRDADGKLDTPLSIWFGLAFIGTAVLFDAANIGPGGLGFGWEIGMNAFFLVTGLTVLIPGLLLTLLPRSE